MFRMSSSRDREQIVQAEEEDRDSLGCSEDSLREKTTVTAIGKVNRIRNFPYIHALITGSTTVYIYLQA